MKEYETHEIIFLITLAVIFKFRLLDPFFLLLDLTILDLNNWIQ